MTDMIEQALREAMNAAYYDLEAAALDMGEDRVDWAALSDYACDAMYGSEYEAEWTAMDYDVRRAIADKIALTMA